MSTIDQAFIKAYAQPPKEKSPLSEAKSRKKVARKPLSLPLEAIAARKKPRQAAPPRSARKPAAKKTPPGKSVVKKNPPPQKATRQSVRASETTYRLDPPQGDLPGPRRMPLQRTTGGSPLFVESSAESVSSGLAEARQGPSDPPPLPEPPVMDSAPSSPEGLYPTGSRQGFRPALQVEYLTWPRDVVRLESAAGSELDRAADCLEKAGARGGKLHGFASCRPGEGVTTLLIAVAKRLAARGRRLLLVDGDAAAPQLARRLGILPQVGWETVLLGRQTLAETAVESVREGIMVLPLRNPLSRDVWNSEGINRWEEIRRTIRGAFDFVLVDLGSRERSPWIGGVDPEWAPPGLDAVWLVRHPEKTAAEELVNVQKLFLPAGTPVLGVMENHVRDLLATSTETV